METLLIKVIGSENQLLTAKVRLWDELTENIDAVRVDFVIGNSEFSAISEKSFFDALCKIRKQMETVGLSPCCYGATENVYPSPMIEAMGNGEKAYQLSRGKQAKSSDLVCIFDSSGHDVPVSVERQQEFYESWIKSL